MPAHTAGASECMACPPPGQHVLLITPVYPALAEAWTRPVFAGSSAT